MVFYMRYLRNLANPYRIEKIDYIKIKNFCSLKEYLYESKKDKPEAGRKYLRKK